MSDYGFYSSTPARRDRVPRTRRMMGRVALALAGASLLVLFLVF